MSFVDDIISLEHDEFTRTMDNGKTIFYKGGVQIKLTHKHRDAVFMDTTPKDKVFSFDLVTLDLETQKSSDGDLRVNDTFGFIRVKVTAPLGLHVPLFETKLNGKTVSPVGTWTGWYFSEELKLALTLGYEFEVIEAVLFERGKVFEKYVSSLYKLRQSFDKADPRNMVCKLLLNSLYGKFGMSPHLMNWKLVKGADKLLDYSNLPVDIVELGDNSLVATNLTRNQVVERPRTEDEELQIIAKRLNLTIEEAKSTISDNKSLGMEMASLMSKKRHLNISLPISAAVTAYLV